MSRYGKCVFTGGFVVVGYGVMVWAMGMMNRPSDRARYAGMAVILALVVAGPWVVRRIWRWWRERNCAKSIGVTQVVAQQPTLEKRGWGDLP